MEFRTVVPMGQEKGNFWGDANILYLDWVVVVQVYTFAQTHRIVHIGSAPFTIYKMYLKEE